MTPSLVALGSNLGDRAATLDSAIESIRDATGVTLLSCSRWNATRPVGISANQSEFLNGVAVVETALEPAALIALLQQIERDHGRQRNERWAARTLDLDLLLYGDRVIESDTLSVPHPRMSYRRFVLEPAVEVAADWVHPTIGWTLGELRQHLDTDADRLAVVSPADSARRELATAVAERCAGQISSPPAVGRLAALWPDELTACVTMAASTERNSRVASGSNAEGASATSPSRDLPKLTVLLDPLPDMATDIDSADWSKVAGQPGRGPTLRLGPSDAETIDREVFAAIESVWPGLCRGGIPRIK